MRNVDANLRSLSFNFFALSAERCLTEVDKFAHMLGNLHASHKFQVMASSWVLVYEDFHLVHDPALDAFPIPHSYMFELPLPLRVLP